MSGAVVEVCGLLLYPSDSGGLPCIASIIFIPRGATGLRALESIRLRALGFGVFAADGN